VILQLKRVLLSQKQRAQSGEGKGQGVPLAADGKSFDFGEKSIKMFERPFIGGPKDSPALVQAQATEHLAALLDGAAKISGVPVSDKAREALRVLGGEAYKQAANEMQAAGLKDESVQTARSYAKSVLAGTHMTRNEALVALDDEISPFVDKGSKAYKALPENQRDKFASKVNERLGQIKLDLKAHEIADDLEKTQNGKGSDDRPTVNHLKKQFGLSTDTPKGQLGTESSNHLVQDIAKVAEDGVTLAKIKEIKDLFSTADKGMKTKRDHGVSSLSAKELQDVRKQLRDGLSK